MDNTYITKYREEWESWRKGEKLMTAKLIKPLSSHVLIVATWGVDGWRAYCDSVPGINHEIEHCAVYESGTKIDEDIARVMFPMYAEIPYVG